MSDTFEILPLASIVTSPTNPRKTFCPDKLIQLANSIKASGVHQPILVRPLPGHRVQETACDAAGQLLAVRPTHEIVAGERRYRASVQAQPKTIPALIPPLSRGQGPENPILENLQRDDLTELEEAEGYEQLMAHSKITAEELGAKIGLSRSYVYTRLKLLDLGVECKQALRTGQIDASRAILIARIPDTALQSKALTEATKADYRGEVMSVRALQAWLQAHVMLKLERAPFCTKDAQLVDGVGGCESCPKRTGAAPDLFVDVPSADICTDPPCYNKKAEAHLARLEHQAKAKGMRLIAGKEARELITDQHSNTIKGYSPLAQVRDDVVPEKRGTSLRKLLGDDLPAAVLIENPYSRWLIEAVPTEAAEQVLIEKGLVKAGKKKHSKDSGPPPSTKGEPHKTLAGAIHNALEQAVIAALKAYPHRIHALAKLLNVDAQAIEQETTRQYHEQEKQAEKTLMPTASLAQPKHAAGEGKAQKTRAAKPRKLSAEDAQLGIADAMQSMEQAASTQPEGQQCDTGAGFDAGQLVRVTQDKEILSMNLWKWAGKSGKVSELHESKPGWVYVTFKGRNGGIGAFASDMLTAVEVML